MIEKYFVGKLPRFYLEIMKAWSYINDIVKQDYIHLDNQILWYNKYWPITHEKQPIFYREWYLHVSNIIFVKDIYIDDKIDNNHWKLKIKSKSDSTVFVFFYLRNAIPKVCTDNLKESILLENPTIQIGKKDKRMEFVSSRVFYHILARDKLN